MSNAIVVRNRKVLSLSRYKVEQLLQRYKAEQLLQQLITIIL